MDRNKMRDLLRKARTFIECSPLKSVENNSGCIDRDKICAEIDAALAAPPRNCDRFATLPDALAAWRDIDPREAGPFDLWLFASATEKEGGAK